MKLMIHFIVKTKCGDEKTFREKKACSQFGLIVRMSAILCTTLFFEQFSNVLLVQQLNYDYFDTQHGQDNQ